MRITTTLVVLATSASLTLAANPLPALMLQNDPTDDEHFVIMNKVFSAKTYCFGWDQGDSVAFVDGNPDACVDAVVYNKRNQETCEVWCP
jgi:hypothetical protein